jgi:hypothetical protein
MQKWKTGSPRAFGAAPAAHEPWHDLDAELDITEARNAASEGSLGLPAEDRPSLDEEIERTAPGPAREVEWVDWLEEYRKMKEAKLRADRSVAGSVAADRGASTGDPLPSGSISPAAYTGRRSSPVRPPSC